MSLFDRSRNERGVAFPSPVVMLSIIAVAMAGIAFVATKDAPEQERRVAPVSQESVAPSAAPTPTAAPEKTKKPKPKINRGKVYVEVFNNSGVTGLAGQTASKITAAGWQVVGSDNWVGHIPADTVYFPPKLKAEAKQLALDLGIKRTREAIAPMKFDRLTVILTG
ncbi:LytR C-terminal domain-containing protein [Nocardioides gilvus]|uniref:LytR C-terminal domain-containing protein n=1 Tax=Nocardioides gilvus TaxID=1735589 RepID=UPI000D7445EE|nr:LytR C-terminal domain-containing protein [Nocardioides gilvus]